MTSLVELEFTALDISGENYFTWMVDAKLHLSANNLGETIEEGNTASAQDRAKAMIFLCRHLHEDLRFEFLMVKDPFELWKLLEERFEYLKKVILLKARNEWDQLRFQDFKCVSEYNSAIYRIKSELNLCGEAIDDDDDDMLEKTFLTFHPSNMLLHQQYRLRGFKKYYELIPYLVLAEQNNELVMKNRQSRHTASLAFPTAYVTSFACKSPRKLNTLSYNNKRGQRWHGYRRGRGCGRGRGRSHNNI